MKNNLTKSLDWEINVRNIKIPGQKKPSNQALVRSDNGKLLSIRSVNYHPVFNRDLEALKDRILQHPNFTFKGYQEFQQGKRILAFFENKSDRLQICGEKVKDYLIIGNSNDASSKLFVGTSNYMFRCENQFSEKIRAYERLHNRPFNIHEIRIDELIHTYEIGRRQLYSKMDNLHRMDADMELIQQLAFTLMGTLHQTDRLEIAPLKKRKQTLLLLKCIELEIRDLGPNRWAVLNGVTRYTSNHLKGNPGFGVVNGLGEKMNREAIGILNYF